MMKQSFKLALIAIFLIIGCVLAHAQEANEANSAVEIDHTLVTRGGSSGNGGGESADDESVGGSPCAPPPKSSTSGSSTPTRRPTQPTDAPTRRPTQPTAAPTRRPTQPTAAPTRRPTQPTEAPTRRPTQPTEAPTRRPTQPTAAPTSRPSTTGKSSSSSGGSTVGLCDVVPASQEPLKLLVPLYVYPGAAWDQVASGASKVGTIAIINPNSGPASSPDSSYTSYMSKLKNAGVEMIGYVYTSYGARAIGDVKKDIDTYASKYPGLTGIFFDEVSASASDISFYTQAYNYVMQKGYSHSILNPGVVPAAGYVDISTSIVVFEEQGSKFSASGSLSSFVTCASSSAKKSGYKYKFAGIAHSTASSSSTSVITNFQKKGLGLVYVTDGASGCCTYNELVSYYSSEVSAVASINQ